MPGFLVSFRRILAVLHHAKCEWVTSHGGYIQNGALVDSNLIVIGVEGLRVMDALVMPQVPNANPKAPTIIIAERGRTRF